LEIIVAGEDSRDLLRHTLATVAYRGRKAVEGAPAGFAEFRVADKSRTPGQILAHIGDLFDWALSLADGQQRWHDSTPLPWDAETTRFFETLGRIDARLAAPAALGCSADKLFQGPIADALTHIGQIAMLRRLAGQPVRAENYFTAEIVAGRVGREQSRPHVEFD
jgi:hypothetical protein